LEGHKFVTEECEFTKSHFPPLLYRTVPCFVNAITHISRNFVALITFCTQAYNLYTSEGMVWFLSCVLFKWLYFIFKNLILYSFNQIYSVSYESSLKIHLYVTIRSLWSGISSVHVFSAKLKYGWTFFMSWLRDSWWILFYFIICEIYFIVISFTNHFLVCRELVEIQRKKGLLLLLFFYEMELN